MTNTMLSLTHCLQQKHEFNFADVRVLDRELSRIQRLISEMIYIKSGVHYVNGRADINNLPSIFNPLIEKFIHLSFFLFPLSISKVTSM